MMSMVGAGRAPDTTAALVLAHTRGRQRRWLVWSAPERLWEESRQTRLLRCMSSELAHRLMIIGRVGFRRVAGGTRTCVGEAVQLCLDLARILLPALTSAGRTITARDCKPDGEDRPASRRRRHPDGIRAARRNAWRYHGRACRAIETAEPEMIYVATMRLDMIADRRRLDDAAFQAERTQWMFAQLMRSRCARKSPRRRTMTTTARCGALRANSCFRRARSTA